MNCQLVVDNNNTGYGLSSHQPFVEIEPVAYVVLRSAAEIISLIEMTRKLGTISICLVSGRLCQV